ncbi:MAG: adenylyltransferase/cytidyltransferase family protein [Flavobacteriales bacterium]|nr:adenylyltransferase/cytidyltransferase family protein [Flavobacteriales bacterium]
MKKGFVCGVFDMYHAGHVLMLKECKENCDYLIVALNKSENIDYSINPDKTPPLYSIEERVMIMESCKYVDKVITYNAENELLELMKKSMLDVRFLGDDYRGKPITGSELNIPIYYTDRSHGLSTSTYKKELINQMNK